MGVSTSLKMNAEKPGLRALASAEIPNLSITACCLVIDNPRRQGRRASSPVVWWIWRFFRGCDLPLPSWGFALPGDQRGSAGPAAQARPVESTRKHTQKRPEEANKKNGYSEWTTEKLPWLRTRNYKPCEPTPHAEAHCRASEQPGRACGIRRSADHTDNKDNRSTRGDREEERRVKTWVKRVGPCAIALSSAPLSQAHITAFKRRVSSARWGSRQVSARQLVNNP